MLSASLGNEMPLPALFYGSKNGHLSPTTDINNGLSLLVSETSDKSDSKLKRRKYLLKKRVNRKDKGE